MAFTNDGITFPVANTGFIVDDRWTFINIDVVGDTFPGDRLTHNVYDVFSGNEGVYVDYPLMLILIEIMKVNSFLWLTARPCLSNMRLETCSGLFYLMKFH
jgi:hypothetical protein